MRRLWAKISRHSVFVIVFGMFLLPAWAQAPSPTSAEPALKRLHILIPGGPGGGWDHTGRAVGDVLRRAGFVEIASFENLSGGGGGRAIGYLIKTAQHQQQTLMVQSTPIIVRSISKVFPFSYRDLTPIARVIGDYAVLAVETDSEYQTFADVLAAFRRDRRSIRIAGGSVRGDSDHISSTLPFLAAGEDPRRLLYVPYDAGAKALAGLLSGEANVLATGFGEALEQRRNGMLRILAVAAQQRLPEAPDVPTYRELGYDAVFINWRGFFGPPGLSEEQADAYAAMLHAMVQTPTWETVRRRYGWANLYLGRKEFNAFLTRQEQELRDLRAAMGFGVARAEE